MILTELEGQVRERESAADQASDPHHENASYLSSNDLYSSW